jgi:hypothetical protein
MKSCKPDVARWTEIGVKYSFTLFAHAHVTTSTFLRGP